MATETSVHDQASFDVRIDRCRARMSDICSRLQPHLQKQPVILKPLVPILSELHQTYSKISRDFPNESERELGHQALMRSLVSASGDVLLWLLALMERIIKSHLSGDLESAPDEAEVLSLMTRSFHNFSDCSVEFVRALAASETFCRGCSLRAINAWTPIFLAGRLGKQAGENLRRFLDIVYNIYFKMDTESDANLARYDFVEPVQPLLQAEDERMSFSALLLVCFGLDESKADYYLGQQKSISLLIRALNSAISNTRRRCLGYHVIELAKCVNRLALNDINKEQLVELELLPVLRRLLDGGKPDEISAAIGVLFTLSFSAAARVRVRREFESQLATLASLPEWSGQASLRGLMFALAEDTVDTARPATAKAATASSGKLEIVHSKAKVGGGDGSDIGGDFHAMISYQHESRGVVKQIRDQLKAHGIKVWIDYEQMTDGSTLSAMADAVENSTLVLMCMSRRYKDSNNCRLEAEYAWRNGKKMVPLLMERGYKPNGWLGLILGASLYNDFSGKYQFEAKFSELLALVRKSLQDGGQQPPQDTTDSAGQSRQSGSANASRQHQREHAMPTPPQLPPIGVKRISGGPRNWSQGDVQKWLTDRELPACLLELRLTGVALHVLLSMRQRAPEAFYAAVQRHFPCADFAEMAQFIDALEEF